jgi:CDP-diacylglycerol--glycerol-3-phosphate 3-phosphatidyltransferase
MTLYDLKPGFQRLLRPLAAWLVHRGVTANQVTLAAALGSVTLGCLLCLWPTPALFLAMPAWLLLRMALNALDGMMAREFGQQSALGGYLNELGDVVADASLLLPFAFIAPFSPGAVLAVIFLAALAEFAGALGPLVGAGRRYDGPLGKSDRAALCGALALWIACGLPLAPWFAWVMPAMAVLLLITIVNRVLKGVRHA